MHGLQALPVENAGHADTHSIAVGKVHLTSGLQAIGDAVQSGLERGHAFKTGAIQIVVEADTANGQAVFKHQDLAGRSHPEADAILQTHQCHHGFTRRGRDGDLVVRRCINLLAGQLQGLRPFERGLQRVHGSGHQRIAGAHQQGGHPQGGQSQKFHKNSKS
ncbi:hypothetical protein D9M71_203410 [compost metagenome]